MKKKFLIFFIFLIASVGYSNSIFFSDIPVFKLIQNEQKTINLSNYINYSKQYKIYIDNYDNTFFNKINLNKSNILIVNSNKTGFTKIWFRFKSKNINIKFPVFFETNKKKYKITLFYKQQKNEVINSIFAAGDFNGWNAKKDELKLNNGIYSLTKEIPEGKYRYKFVVNGKWITDINNKIKESDGFGGFNSILNIGKTIKNIVIKPVWMRISKRRDKTVFLRFQYNSEYNSQIKCYVILNNLLIKTLNLKNNKSFEIRKKSEYFSAYTSNKVPNINFIFTSNNVFLKQIKIPIKLNKQFTLRDTILYFLFTDRFYDFNKSNDEEEIDSEVAKIASYEGGDFEGITEKITTNYFKKLGINTLWISPVNDNPKKAFKDSLPPHRKFTGYHGYWPIDFYKIEEHFGKTKDLKKLVSTAHKKNMKVFLDFVANHTHIDNVLYKQNKDMFGKLYLKNGKKNIRLFDKYPLTTWFDDFLPSFDYSNKKAIKYMCDNAVWLIKNFKFDGFRLDAVKHIPHKFWKSLRKLIRKNFEKKNDKNFYMVGETISSREKIKEYINFNELNAQFDFPLYWTIRDVFAVEKNNFIDLNNSYLNSIKIYGNNNLNVCFLGNHDFSRFMAYADGKFKPNTINEKEYGWSHKIKVDNIKNYKKLKSAFTFLMTIPNIPMIYYGDEFGMTGAQDPDNRRMMRFNNELTEPEKEVKNYVTKLISIRNKYKTFRYGIYQPIKIEKEYMIYLIQYFNDQFIVILNRNKEGLISFDLPSDIIPKAAIVELLHNTKINKFNNKIQLKIKTNESYILHIKDFPAKL